MGESAFKTPLKEEDFENHFNVLMQNAAPFNADQVKIQSDVHERKSHVLRAIKI